MKAYVGLELCAWSADNRIKLGKYKIKLQEYLKWENIFNKDIYKV